MELKSQQGYSKEGKNSIKSLIISPSGRFIDGNGNTVTVANLDQYLTSKKDLLEKVANGEYGSATDTKYVTRSLNYTSFDETSKSKHPDIVANYDHLVMQGMPANLSNDDLKKYEQVIAETFSSLDMFYTADGRPNLLTGNREVLVRIDKMDNATQAPHIHILVNRHSVADRSKLITDLQFCTDPEKSKAIQKALDFSVGKDKVLMQSANFSTDNYVSKMLVEELNKNLLANGLIPITGHTMADGKGTSNAKVAQQTKVLTKELEQENFTEEVVEKVIEKAKTEVSYGLDSVVIQKRVNTNNTRLAELTEEVRRIASENRILDEAQIALNDNNSLKNKNIELNQEIEKKDTEILQIKEQKTEVEKIAESRNEYLNAVISVMGITPYELKEMGLTPAEVVKEKLEEKDNDYKAVEEELSLFKEETKIVIEEIKKENETIKKVVEEKETLIVEEKNAHSETKAVIEKIKLELTDSKSLNETLNKSVESMQIVTSSVSKLNESLQIQVAEGHKKNSELLKDNISLQAEIEKLKADNAKQMKETKEQQAEADKKLEIEKQRNISLEREIAEKDIKFREFATKFVSEVGEKLKKLSANISSLAKGITDPNKKKVANDIARDVKGSLSDFTKKFGLTDKPDEQNKSGNDTPKKKF